MCPKGVYHSGVKSITQTYKAIYVPLYFITLFLTASNRSVSRLSKRLIIDCIILDVSGSDSRQFCLCARSSAMLCFIAAWRSFTVAYCMEITSKVYNFINSFYKKAPILILHIKKTALTDKSTGSISGNQGKGNSGRVISSDIETERNKTFLKLMNWKK